MRKILNSIGKPALAILLSIAALLTFLPLSVFALALQDAAASDSTTYSDEPFELIDLREENAKYFQNTDGTKVVAVYDTPVHRVDENGVWQDIDNTLAKSGDEYATSDARVKFSKKITGNETFFTLHEGNHKITFGLSGAIKKTRGEVIENTTEHPEDATQLQKMMTLDKLNSCILYADILEGVDLEYIVAPGSIKENIIVKEQLNAYSYTFELELNGLAASLDANGRVLLSDTSSGETVYVIPAGYMIDANGAISYDVTYALQETGTGKYSLTVTANSAWINASDRAFPVKIDPSINSSWASSVTDLQITSGINSPDTNDVRTITVTSTSSMYWKLNVLPYLSPFANIISASYRIYYNSVFLGKNETDYSIGIYDVLTNWDATLVWNQAYATTNPQGQRASTYTCDERVGAYGSYSTLNITPIAKGWYEGENYGLCIAAKNPNQKGGVMIYSSDDSSYMSSFPTVTICYEEIRGIEDYWSYATQDAGFAGSGAINYANGQLTFAVPTLTTTDALFGFTPTLYYNAGFAGVAVTSETAATPTSYAYMPYGFHSNMHDTLQYDLGIGGYVWLDGDGTEHEFKLSEANDGTYVDQDGLQLTLAIEESTATITDANHYKRHFQEGAEGFFEMNCLIDPSGNRLYFNGSSISVRPAGYDSGFAQMYIYYIDNVPYLFLNQVSGEAVILRYSYTPTGSIGSTYNRYLRQVVRAHGSTSALVWESFYNSNSNADTAAIQVDAVADYTYNEDGSLASVTNELSQYCISYTYDNIGRVTAVEEFADSGLSTAGQKITFEYLTSATRVRTSGTDDIHGNADDLLTT